MSSEFTLGMMYLLAYFSIAIEKEGGQRGGTRLKHDYGAY